MMLFGAPPPEHLPAHASMPSSVAALAEIGPLLARFVSQADNSLSLANFTYTADYRGLRVRASFGMGVRARVPWLGLFGDPIARPSEEWYPVVLYYKTARVLVVAYGIGEACKTRCAWGELAARPVHEVLPTNFQHAPERYGSSLVAAAFKTGSDLDFGAVAAAVDLVVDRYFEQRRQSAQA